MSRAVRYDDYGDVDVLHVVDVRIRVPGAGQLLVRVKAAGINPGESKIREGLLPSAGRRRSRRARAATWPASWSRSATASTVSGPATR